MYGRMTNRKGDRTRLSNAPDHDLRISRGVRQQKSSANQSPEGQEPLPNAASQEPIAETYKMATTPLASARETGGGTHQRRKRGERHGVVEIAIATDS